MSVLIFKPDEIGDFVIATGAIRLLAREHGEENTSLIVKSELASLARREFPLARVVALPWQRRRKGHNQAVANIRHCFPVWLRLCRTTADQIVCLRSQRNYLQTLFFASPKVRGRFAPENTLLLSRKWRRVFVEKLLRVCKNPSLVPYPEPAADWPAEIEAHRLVLTAALGREVAQNEIMPALTSVTWRGGAGWLFCPFSSRRGKDYSAERWVAALQGVVPDILPTVIRLAGGPDQVERLNEFASVLRAGAISCPVEVIPPMPLEEFPDLVSVADLLLTVDTGAAHFACATGAPAVIVASGLHQGAYGPYSPNGRQVWLLGDYAGRGAKGWQDSVPPSMVAEVITRLLRT
ncbi:MAG: glycosyltransferase family 9 protein [Chthoniobacterales bacterium]|nr:glycosyltransferase family 9 protein [Chthoniobacterales bacterium]